MLGDLGDLAGLEPALLETGGLGEGDCRRDVAARGGDLGVVFVGVVRGAGFGAGDLDGVVLCAIIAALAPGPPLAFAYCAE